MKCNDSRIFLSQIAGKSVSTLIGPGDLNFLATNGYVNLVQKQDYDQAVADVANLTQMNEALQNEIMQERTTAAGMWRDERKTHSILFHFEGRDRKEAEIANLQSERTALASEQADIAAKDSKIRELIMKKSAIDRMVPYNGQYVSLTGLGVVTLNDLNIRNYRVSDEDFSAFIEETKETSSELRSIAERSVFESNSLRTELPNLDPTQIWSVSIGLGKLQGDPVQLNQRFLLALRMVEHFKSTMDNKMMAAEIVTAVRPGPTDTPTDNSDVQNLAKPLSDLDKQLRHHAKVPKQLSAGVAATVMFGRRYDGSYPIDTFIGFSKITRSYESAAILSVINDPSSQLPGKFQAFRSMFNLWGFQTSEDTELASAYLATSDLGPDDVRVKMQVIIDALKLYLEYPLVASAILASIATFEANEALDLTEKAFSILGSYAPGLQRSELLSLSVRMIHGVKNELVKKLDPSAPITNTPVQFRYAPLPIFFPYHVPLIVAHSSYYSTFSGIGGVHPAHVHGFGGGFGG
jgi:hypothetical protein